MRQYVQGNTHYAHATARLRQLAVVACLFSVILSIASASAQNVSNDEVSLRRLQQAAAAIGAGEFKEAENLLGSVLAGSPKDADALNLLGVVRARQDRSIDAEALFRRALDISPNHLGAHINLGELYINTNRPQLALRILLAGHKRAPDRAEINLKLAELYGDTGKHERALDHLNLIPHSEASAEYFSILLRSLLKLNRLEEARQIAREFKERRAGEADDRIRFAMLLAAGGLTDEARDFLEVMRSQTADSFPVLYALGVINTSAKGYDQAEEYLTAALSTKPEDVATLRALAKIARIKGNFEKALAHLVQARRVSPDAPEVLYDFGATAMQMGLILDALPVFQKLNNLHRREPVYAFALATAQLKRGELKEAERLARRYLALRPQDGAGFYLLGATLHLLNRYGEARAALERSLKVRPDIDAEFLLGLTLYEQGNRPVAIEMLRRVVLARPEHAAAQAALGTAYRDLGNYADARIALERSVELDPKDLRATYQLGLVYAKLGNKDGAKQMFDRADQLRTQQRERETIILKLIDLPQN